MIRYFLFAVIFLFMVGVGEVSASQTYVVKKRDTLNKIAKRFKVSVEEIKLVNNLESVTLRPGERLKIPAKVAKQKRRGQETAKRESVKSERAALARAAAGQADAARSGTLYHTVRKGETLRSISRKYSLSVGDLADLNGLRKSARLKPGERLAVKKDGPRTYVVKRGDTIYKIANRFNLSAEDLMEINDLDSAKLKTGQRLALEVWDNGSDAVNSSAEASANLSADIKAMEASPELQTLSVKNRLILFAKKMLNIPYRFGGSTFMGIECSAYVQTVFALLDMSLPRTAREQYHVGEPVSKEDLSIGDLVFFRTYASFPSHVGIYLGNNLFIHASSRSKKVAIDSLDTPYYLKRFIGAKRLFNDEMKDNIVEGDNG